jgi:hypothetical protein
MRHVTGLEGGHSLADPLAVPGEGSVLTPIDPQPTPVPRALRTDEAPEHVRSYAETVGTARTPAEADLRLGLGAGLPVAPVDENTFYQGGDAGYLTYPTYQHAA